jgi:hypothetical protein
MVITPEKMAGRQATGVTRQIPRVLSVGIITFRAWFPLNIPPALDPKVIATGFANNGQNVPVAGQIASLTSTNNFINFCLTKFPITNGQQIKTGSCNPAPMGIIPSTANMPSSKFVNPTNFGTVKANTAFTIEMAISNMETGFFVNAESNYFAAPQFLNQKGQIQGHSHVVIEQLSAIDQTTVTDPTKFVFFKGLNSAAKNGKLTAAVANGLPVGVYKLSSINSAANHQPVLVSIAQHGALDDAIYVCVTSVMHIFTIHIRFWNSSLSPLTVSPIGVLKELATLVSSRPLLRSPHQPYLLL